MPKNEFTPFQRALVNSVLIDYEKMLDQAPDIVPSPQFEQWAQKMIQRGMRKVRIGKVAKAVLIAAIIIALLAVTAMAIPAIRDSIIDFFLHEHSDHYSITFDPIAAATAPKEIEKHYSLSYIPHEYILAATDATPSGLSSLWINADGHYIYFMQWPMPGNPEEDSRLGLNTATDRTSVIMGDYLVELLHNENNDTKLVWTNNEYYFVLELPSDMPQEEIDKIFASWGPFE